MLLVIFFGGGGKEQFLEGGAAASQQPSSGGYGPVLYACTQHKYAAGWERSFAVADSLTLKSLYQLRFIGLISMNVSSNYSMYGCPIKAAQCLVTYLILALTVDKHQSISQSIN